MSSPALNASGDYAVVYDVGGQELNVIGQGALLHKLSLSEEESLLCATINEKGWVAVTSKVSGYKGLSRYTTGILRPSSPSVRPAAISPTQWSRQTAGVST